MSRPPTTPGWVYAHDGMGKWWCAACGAHLRDKVASCICCGGDAVHEIHGGEAERSRLMAAARKGSQS